jgi:lantibiotic modifying enzyme
MGSPESSLDDVLLRALVQAASIIAAQLLDERIESQDGWVTWRAATTAWSGARLECAELGPYLYDGTTGVALFLSAFARATDSQEHAVLALRAIQPLRGRLRTLLGGAQEARFCIGALDGISSILYGFLCIGRLLGDEGLLDEAHELSVFMGPAEVQNDRHLDVASGSAGALLVLLALDRVRPYPNRRGRTPLELAALCAHHLVDQVNGSAMWTSATSCADTGFAHGAAGICCALGRLVERTGDASLRETIARGLAFERRLYSREHGNWSNCADGSLAFSVAWCYGAAGIALARLALIDILEDPWVRAEIAAGIEATQRRGLCPADHICCGNSGLSETLLQIALCLGDADLRAGAYESIRRLLRWAKRRGHFVWWPGAGDGRFNPGFFKGATGAAYSLLRFAAPGSLPSVLTFE